MIKKKSLYIWYFVLLIMIVSCAASITLVQRNMRQNAIDNVCESLRETSRDRRTSFALILDSQFSIMDIFAERVEAETDFGSSRIQNSMKLLLRRSSFSKIAVTGKDMISYDSDGNSINVLNLPYVNQVLSGKHIIEYVENENKDENGTFIVAAPIEHEGKIKGFVSGILNEDILYNFLLSYDAVGSGYSVICDNEGNIIAGSSNMPIRLNENNFIDAISESDYKSGYSKAYLKNDLKEGNAGEFFFSSNNQDSYAYFIPLGINNWNIISIASMDVVESHIEPDIMNITVIISSFFLIGIALAFLISLYVMRRHRRNEKKRLEEIERLSAAAKYDSVTGLLNFENGFYQMEKFLNEITDNSEEEKEK